jgi:uncharacterized protein (DUF2062 family)/SAM-dependent methyltransferase
MAQYRDVSLSISALRRTFYELRTEGQGPAREACAIGVGVFIGCSPFYGFHLLMSWVCGRLFGLNRLKVYLASNISNPLVAPMLVLAEIQTGAWLRTGSFLAVTLQTVKTISLWQFGLDLFLGSAVIGGVLGGIGGIATYFTLRDGHEDPFFAGLVKQASERYVGESITAWEFARNKLRRDPLYREVLFRGWLPSGGTLLDIGCGQGLMLALLAEAERVSRDGSVPPGTQLPRFDRIVGIELRTHRARLARAALGPDADIIESDARSISPGDCRAVLFFDVLHMMPEADQDALLSAAVGALENGGVILVREADASAGWRFHAVRIGNRLMALASGAWGQRLAFRTVSEWRECFARHGLDAESTPAGMGTPFANHLFRLTVRPAESAAAFPREQSA